MCSSGQQILRGDRVIVKGEKPGKKSRVMIKVWWCYAGTVKYIGRLEGGLSNDVYIGVQLDAPGWLFVWVHSWLIFLFALQLVFMMANSRAGNTFTVNPTTGCLFYLLKLYALFHGGYSGARSAAEKSCWHLGKFWIVLLEDLARLEKLILVKD